jgi:predicted membrane chloride channel (bestrophin family)
MGGLMVPTCFFCSYVLIGIDELGVQIEEPSAILPLVPLLNKIRFEIQAAVREVHAAPDYAV